jgi:mannan endo-1,4-beta-mannosidase
MSRRQVLGLGIGAMAALLGSAPGLAQVKLRRTCFVRGRQLYDAGGRKLVLRGINLPLLDDWAFPQRHTLAELAKTGANAVRIQWYVDYGQPTRPAYSPQDLDNFLTECRSLRLIPILGLWDGTCKADMTLLNTQIVPWWISEPILPILQKHQRYLIVNLANELGLYRWTNDPAAALTTYKDAYKQAIATLRQHLKVPIMIDAPDCGTSIEVFRTVAQELMSVDRNLLFSAHAYWAAYNGMAQIPALIRANIPLVFGEIANKQQDGVNGKTEYCYYDLDSSGQSQPAQNGFTYQRLLRSLKNNEIGWLAWAWWKDGCALREMTRDGSFSGLTPYGQDLVNNPVYGLKATAVRSTAF